MEAEKKIMMAAYLVDLEFQPYTCFLSLLQGSALYHLYRILFTFLFYLPSWISHFSLFSFTSEVSALSLSLSLPPQLYLHKDKTILWNLCDVDTQTCLISETLQSWHFNSCYLTHTYAPEPSVRLSLRIMLNIKQLMKISWYSMKTTLQTYIWMMNAVVFSYTLTHWNISKKCFP